MLCDACREADASVHLTKVVEGEVTLVHLCAACAAERGIETTTHTTPKNVLGEFLHAAQQQVASDKGSTAEETTCTFCGLSLREFRSVGRLGCASCYTAFEPSLRQLLRRVHGNAQHVGRKYLPPATEILARATTVGELRDRLRRAIVSEEFELAATLRDQLRDVE
jgi:protein arginine kinase activator